jgi:hypothetical protein
MSKPGKAKPRNLGEALVSVVNKATYKWTATKKSEERHPSQIRYRGKFEKRRERDPREIEGRGRYK